MLCSTDLARFAQNSSGHIGLVLGLGIRRSFDLFRSPSSQGTLTHPLPETHAFPWAIRLFTVSQATRTAWALINTVDTIDQVTS